MTEIIYSTHFLRAVKKLPPEVRRLAEEQCFRFVKDNKDPLLHVKPLAGELKGAWSFRIGRNHRVLYRPLSATLFLFYDVDDRKDIYS